MDIKKIANANAVTLELAGRLDTTTAPQLEAELKDCMDAADELTLEVFGAAVREFIGMCARMPYMTATFANMPGKQKEAYRDYLNTIEGWCEKSRQALESYAVEGGIIIG